MPDISVPLAGLYNATQAEMALQARAQAGQLLPPPVVRPPSIIEVLTQVSNQKDPPPPPMTDEQRQANWNFLRQGAGLPPDPPGVFSITPPPASVPDTHWDLIKDIASQWVAKPAPPEVLPLYKDNDGTGGGLGEQPGWGDEDEAGSTFMEAALTALKNLLTMNQGKIPESQLDQVLVQSLPPASRARGQAILNDAHTQRLFGPGLDPRQGLVQDLSLVELKAQREGRARDVSMIRAFKAAMSFDMFHHRPD